MTCINEGPGDLLIKRVTGTGQLLRMCQEANRQTCALVALTSSEETGNTEKRVSEVVSLEKGQPGDRAGGVGALPR